MSGGAGADVIFGSSAAETLLGGADGDLLIGGGGNDVLFGGVDNDLIYGGVNRDILYGGSGRDTIYGGDDQDQIFVGFHLAYIDPVLGAIAAANDVAVGEIVDASAATLRASSRPSSSAPSEQHPWPRCSERSGRMPWQPRPQIQVQFEPRNVRSNRHSVSPASTST